MLFDKPNPNVPDMSMVFTAAYWTLTDGLTS